MATHSSILAWKIPWTEEPVDYSGPQSMWSQSWTGLNVHTHTHTHNILSIIDDLQEEVNCQNTTLD